MNPRYTGRQVWNRQRRDEVLLDVEDVAAGHQSRMRWNPETAWVWSTEPSHEAIVTVELFQEVQAQLRQGARRGFDRKARSSERPYACQRALSGAGMPTPDGGHLEQRQAALPVPLPLRVRVLANRIEHPRSVYLREDAVLPSLDGWLGRLFEPRNVHTTIDAIASAPSTDASPAKTVTDEARRVADEVEQQLARYRAALDAGADPSVVASWIADAQTRRSRAEQVLRCRQAPTRMGRDEIEAVIRGLGDLFQTLRGAHPANKAEISMAAWGCSSLTIPPRSS